MTSYTYSSDKQEDQPLSNKGSYYVYLGIKEVRSHISGALMYQGE